MTELEVLGLHQGVRHFSIYLLGNVTKTKDQPLVDRTATVQTMAELELGYSRQSWRSDSCVSHQGSHSSERGGGVGLSQSYERHMDNARATEKPTGGVWRASMKSNYKLDTSLV